VYLPCCFRLRDAKNGLRTSSDFRFHLLGLDSTVNNWKKQEISPAFFFKLYGAQICHAQTNKSDFGPPVLPRKKLGIFVEFEKFLQQRAKKKKETDFMQKRFRWVLVVQTLYGPILKNSKGPGS